MGIGPFANLALLEMARPGSLGRVLVVMGMDPAPCESLPSLGPEMDWNVQWDTQAAEILAATARLTLVTLPVTLKAHLRGGDLPRLRLVLDGGVLRFQPSQQGRRTRVVVDVDGAGFTQTWLAAVEAAQQRP